MACLFAYLLLPVRYHLVIGRPARLRFVLAFEFVSQPMAVQTAALLARRAEPPCVRAERTGGVGLQPAYCRWLRTAAEPCSTHPPFDALLRHDFSVRQGESRLTGAIPNDAVGPTFRVQQS